MKTRLTELLGIKHPIIQSAMGWVATPPLVCAACNAGGLGLLAPTGLSAEELRQQIREIREATGGALFGVNIVPFRPGFKRHIRVVLEEKVPVWSSGLRDPFATVSMNKPEGVIYIPTVGSVSQAVSVEKAGADAVIVQGWEGGGHCGRIASTVLIPEVVRAVRIPVIAAGGFCDGKGLASALALGAEGIAMGTRFATTKESPLPLQLKQRYLQARDTDAVLSTVWDGIPMRVIRGEGMGHYRGWWTRFWELPRNLVALRKLYKAGWRDMMEAAGALRQMHVSLPQFLAGMEMFRRAVVTGSLARAFSPAGQVVGRIEDIPDCRELMERTVSEAERVIADLRKRLSDV